ncbi:MAG: glycosyltransferase family 2 protein [Myxococcota bacterium]
MALSYKNLCIVVPVFNEGNLLHSTLEDLLNKRPYDAVVVVDDGSTDNCATIASDRNIPLIRLPLHLGYGVAVQTGLKYAYNNNFKYAILFDGDGQHEASSIEGLLTALEEKNCDIVIGSRFLYPTFKTNFIKRFAIIFFSIVTRIFTGLKITDPTSGFIAFNRTGMRYYIHDNLPHKYPDTDALIMLHRAGVKLGEAPVVMYPSRRRSMHYGLGTMWYMANMIFSVTMSLLRPKRME